VELLSIIGRYAFLKPEVSVKKQLELLKSEPNPIKVIDRSILYGGYNLYPMNSNSCKKTKNKILELKI